MKKFEIGKIYNFDLSCTSREFPYKCVKRTEKMVWFQSVYGNLSICGKITVIDGKECVFPSKSAGMISAE